MRVSRLDELQELTNELILEQNRLLSSPEAKSVDSGKLARLSKSLRRSVVGLRMTPLSWLFQKLHRVVRETGRRLKCEIEFASVGDDVEIDRSVIDSLSELLMQIVRNAAVHGIESSEERMAAGKPLMGKITVAARSAGVDVVISVADDGRGISAESVAAAAGKNGRPVPVPATSGELLALIMRSGVTTSAQAVTRRFWLTASSAGRAAANFKAIPAAV